MQNEQASPGVTRLLSDLRAGRHHAAEELLPLVYRELHQLAAAAFAKERNNHTLQPTALAHEAWLKIADGLGDIETRRQFFGIAANAMRQVLIDHARRRAAARRGGGRDHITLDTALASAAGRDVDLLAFDDSLRRLAEVNARHARIVELRAFVGLTIEEVAELLSISRHTVNSDWQMAKAWLRCELAD